MVERVRTQPLLITARILSVTLFVMVLAIGAAFPQAAAEWGLLNGNSAVAGAKAATAFGNRLSRSNKIAEQIPKVRPKPEARMGKRVTQPATSSSGTAMPMASSMILSIQGGRATHSLAHPNSPPANPRSSPN